MMWFMKYNPNTVGHVGFNLSVVVTAWRPSGEDS